MLANGHWKTADQARDIPIRLAHRRLPDCKGTFGFQMIAVWPSRDHYPPTTAMSHDRPRTVQSGSHAHQIDWPAVKATKAISGRRATARAANRGRGCLSVRQQA